MNDNTPIFDLDINNPEKTIDAIKFHTRLVEFISDNIDGVYHSELLCYMVDEESGSLIEAILPKNAYKQSLLKSIDFYKEMEIYEKCMEIEDLINRIQ